MGERHTVIVGGGLIGVSCAYYLVKRGERVTLLERAGLGEAASFGNAGSIAPGHAPINKPGRARQAFKWMFNPVSPLYIARPLDPSLIRWLWQFQAKCTETHFMHCMELLGPLGHLSADLFDEIIESEQLECDYRASGYYDVFRTEQALAKGRLEAELQKRYGHSVEEIPASEMRSREPALLPDIKGALLHRRAATLNPHHFVVELAARCDRQGASIRTGAEVERVIAKDGRATGVRLTSGEVIDADVVVLATGAYSQHLWEKLGYRIPLQAAKGYHRDSDPHAGGAPPLRQACILAEAFVFCSPIDDFVRFAGTLEFSGVNHEIRRPRLDALTVAARRYFANVGDAGTRSEWCGLRPCLADGLPAVGWVRGIAGLFMATGHAMMGLTLAPATGKLAAEWILNGKPSLDVSAMDAARF
ncbi:MAG: FAD-dependent oxidoreductase [Planctomycetota bacterium]